MKLAKYEIPIIIAPPKKVPYERLYENHTQSSNRRNDLTKQIFSKSRASHRFEDGFNLPRVGKDGDCDRIEWVLKSKYDQANDTFSNKSEVFYTDDATSEFACSKQKELGPIRQKLKERGSLLTQTTALEVTEIHALTAPRTRHGYSRNPTGSFYWD